MPPPSTTSPPKSKEHQVPRDHQFTVRPQETSGGEFSEEEQEHQASLALEAQEPSSFLFSFT